MLVPLRTYRPRHTPTAIIEYDKTIYRLQTMDRSSTEPMEIVSATLYDEYLSQVKQQHPSSFQTDEELGRTPVLCVNIGDRFIQLKRNKDDA